MTRLTSRSDGSGRPLSETIAGWAAANPQIRRVWLSASRDEDIALTLELRPVADSEETLVVWMAHSGSWHRQLLVLFGRPVALDWQDADSATTAAQPSSGEAKTLVYERAR